jgi:hypothetical protein
MMGVELKRRGKEEERKKERRVCVGRKGAKKAKSRTDRQRGKTRQDRLLTRSSLSLPRTVSGEMDADG